MKLFMQIATAHLHESINRCTSCQKPSREALPWHTRLDFKKKKKISCKLDVLLLAGCHFVSFAGRRFPGPTDLCFRCGKRGHWSSSCTKFALTRSIPHEPGYLPRSLAPGASRRAIQCFPIIRCKTPTRT